MQASFTKLRSGDWGIRVTGGVPEAGQSVVVAKRDGSSDTVSVDRVVWSGEGVALCAIVRRAKGRSGGYYSQRASRYRPCGYPGCSPGYCDECDGEGAGAGGGW